MASHNAIIISILQTALGVSIKGISPVPLHDDAEFPFITVQSVVGQDVEGLEGDLGLESDLMQVNSWSHDYEEANSTRALAKTTLSGYAGTVLGVVVQGSNHDSNHDIYDPVRELHQCTTRLKFWFKEG